MLFKNFIFVYFMVLLSGSLIAISSNSWLIAWLGLEINMMVMIPIILFKTSFYFSEAGIKYFLAQAMASFVIMMNFMMSMMVWNFYFMVSSEMIMMSALSLKAGLAPFHFWFPQVIMQLEWIQCLIMMTWQKVAPLFLISVFYDHFFIYFIIFLSGFVGFSGGFNQILMKPILTYSSIMHSSWMTMLSISSIKGLTLYFMIYSVMTASMIMVLEKNSFKNMNQMASSKMSVMTKLLIMFSAVSLAGLPPFMGFSAKLMAIKMSINLSPMFIVIMLINFSLLSLFYYFKFMYNNSVMYSNQSMITKEKSHNNSTMPLLSINILFNFMTPLMINMC